MTTVNSYTVTTMEFDRFEHDIRLMGPDWLEAALLPAVRGGSRD